MRSYAIPEESISLIKVPLEVAHRMEAGELEAGLLVTEADTRGGCTIERLAGERESGRAIVPPPL